ncbi:MAG: DNA adenine methylase [Thiogranum sp.]|nr:DNA adenine methylase [Thiogranum sp.]
MQLDLLESHSSSLEKNQTSVFPKKPFRTLHYLGSKLRMLEFIKTVADEEDPDQGAICDLFSGSGAVSQYLSNYRRIISVDIQEYSRVICEALLRPCSEKNILVYGKSMRASSIRPVLEEALRPLVNCENKAVGLGEKGDLEPVCNFLENCSLYGAIDGSACNSLPNLKLALTSALRLLDELDGLTALASTYFGGVYFSFEQAIHIDVILNEIRCAPPKYKNTLMAALLGTASDLVNSVGKQFAQPIRPRKKNGEPKPNLIRQLSRDRDRCVFDTFEAWLDRYSGVKEAIGDHEIFCMDYKQALDRLPEDVGIVYADPPYTRDHYSRFYHGLETLCLQDSPVISKTSIGGSIRLSRGLYRQDRHQSPFCIKSQAPDAFKQLFRKVAGNGKILMLSYSPYDKEAKAHPRVMKLEQLLSLAEQYFSHVKSCSPGAFSHSKLNHSEKHLKASDNGEIVIVCRN